MLGRPSRNTGKRSGGRRCRGEVVVAAHRAACFASLVVNRHPRPDAMPRSSGGPSVEALLISKTCRCRPASMCAERGWLRVSPLANGLGTLERRDETDRKHGPHFIWMAGSQATEDAFSTTERFKMKEDGGKFNGKQGSIVGRTTGGGDLQPSYEQYQEEWGEEPTDEASNDRSDVDFGSTF